MKRNPYLISIRTELSEALEKGINRGAVVSPEIAMLLGEIEGNTIRVVLDDVGCEFAVRVDDNYATVTSEDLGGEDLLVRTSLTRLVALMRVKKMNPEVLEGVEIIGDVQLAQNLYRVFKSIDFDWEEVLSRRIGDVPAHQVSRALKWGVNQASSLKSTFESKLKSALMDEHHLVVPHSRVNQFADDADVLMMNLDRLQKRVEKLEAGIK